jgi:hypothetical protein
VAHGTRGTRPQQDERRGFHGGDGPYGAALLALEVAGRRGFGEEGTNGTLFSGGERERDREREVTVKGFKYPWTCA